MKRLYFIFAVLLSVMLSGSYSLAQGIGASVDESQESATLWVDPAKGLDTNPGTQTQPLKTLAAAFGVASVNNHNQIGTKIWATAGVYRESITLTGSSRDTSAPVTLQAVTPGTALVSGATQFTGWAPYTAIPGAYSNAWSYQWGTCPADSSENAPLQPDIMLRREMVFLNGNPLTQVMTTSALVPGTFTVDETNAKIYIYPAAGTNMATADVEVSTSSNLLTISGKNYVVVRGMVFQYSNGCRSAVGYGASPAVTIKGTSTNVVLDNDVLQWNNSNGLQINTPAKNFTISNTSANHNGQAGFGVYQTTQGLWLNNSASYNNWRGAQGGVYNWNVGGFHPFQNHYQTIAGMNMYWNQTYGAHWDTDHANIQVSGMTSVNNLMAGDFYEKVQGPINIDGSLYCNNNQTLHDQSGYQGGLNLRNSERVSLSNSTIFGNGVSQFNVQGQAGGLPIVDFETGATITLVTSGVNFSNNTFANTDPSQMAFSDAYLGDADWTMFLTGNPGTGSGPFASDYNLWSMPESDDQGVFMVPMPFAHTQLEFEDFRAETGTDVHSSFVTPSASPFACQNVASDYPDFWLVLGTQSLTLDASGNATQTISLPAVGSNSGSVSVSLDISGIPGLSYTVSPLPLSMGSVATVNFSSLPSTAEGTYVIPVMATAANGVAHNSTMYLTVPRGSLRITPASLSFPNTVIRTDSVPLSTTITNGGQYGITFSSYAVDSHFRITDNQCPAAGSGIALGSGESCSITMVLNYATAGNYTNKKLTITDSDPSSPSTIDLDGRVIGAPTASFTPTAINCGTINMDSNGGGGVPCTMTAILKNTSFAAPISINSITQGSDTYSNWTYYHDCPMSPDVLDTQASCTFTATYTASLPAATQNSTVVVTDNSSSGSHTLSLNGTSKVIYPTPKFSSATLAFGSVAQGTTKKLTSTFTNTQTNKLGALNFQVIGDPAGADADEYDVTNNCPTTLAAGASCTFTVIFAPVNLDVTKVTVTVTDNASPATQVLTLTGTGIVAVPTASLSPGTLTFGTVTMGTTLTKTSTLTNTSTNSYATLTLTPPFNFTGTTAGDWSQTNNCPANNQLAPGASCVITVKFAPAATGTRNSTLPVNNNTSAGKSTLTVTGTGAAAVPTVSFSPSPLGFGSITLGTTLVKTVTMTNTSTNPQASLILTPPFIFTGTTAGDWSQINDCPANNTLAPGASCTFTVTFAPTVAASRNTTLSITNNTSAKKSTLTVTGTGLAAVPTATFDNSTLAFGSVTVGTPSTLTATLTNTSTNSYANLTLTPPFAFTGTTAGDWSQTNDCPSSNTLAPGASCTFTVTFTPSSKTSRNSTLSITNNTSGKKTVLTVTGSGK